MGTIYDGVDARQITSRTLWGNQSIGTVVCKFWRATFYTCGEIVQKDFIPAPGCIPNARPTFVRVITSVAQGDSGGPVFVSNSSYGTTACISFAGDLVYVAVDFIEGGLGVTILTTP